jgi:hypothetical protein
MPDERTDEMSEQVEQDQTPPETGEQESQDDFDKERAMETIRTLRTFEKQAKKQERELEQLRQQIQEQEDAKKSDLERAQESAEKAQAERDAALRTANDRLIKAEVKMLASDAEINIVPEAVNDAYLLMAKDDIEVSDDGTVSGVKEALKALVEAKPWLRVSDQQPRAVPASPRPAGQQSRQELIAQETEKLRRSGQYGI